MKKVLYSLLLTASVAVTSCDRDNDNPVGPINPPQAPLKGVLVLSEGNFSNETGKLGYISPQGTYTDNLYYQANGERLGHIAQDLFIAADKIYIVTQNGEKNGGKGLVIIADAKTYKRIKVYSASDLPDLQNPSNLAVVAPYIYIRDRKGIHALNEQTGKLAFIPNTDGATNVSMTTLQGVAYALAGSKLLALKDGKLSASVDLGTALSGVQRSQDGQLWIADEGNTQIIKYDPTKGTKQAHSLGDAPGIGKGWGYRSALSATGDTIYFSNAKLTIYRHIFSQNVTKQVADVSTLEPNVKINYNSLAVDPETGYVYFAGLKTYPEYKTENNILVLDPKTNYSVKYNLKGYTAFPAGVFPIASF